MDFKVILKDTFVADLGRIIRSIAIHNPKAAETLGEVVISTAENLGRFPERHPQVRERQGIRRFIVKKHFKVF